MDILNEALLKLKRLENEIERLKTVESLVDHGALTGLGDDDHPQYSKVEFVPLTTPLTSTAWDGDAYSTTAKTKIDLSAVFGVPAGVKAVLFSIYLRDSGSAANECALILSPNNTADKGIYSSCSGLSNNMFFGAAPTIPCDLNGDVYYQIKASGVGTMDIYLEVWGYWL